MLYDQAGPEIETFAGGMKIDAGPPKFSEIKSRKVLTQIWSWFLSKIRWRPKKKGLHSNLVVLVQNLTAPKTRARVRYTPWTPLSQALWPGGERAWRSTCPPIYAIVISEVNLANKKLKI